jgi:hypothetical protein
MFDLRFFIYGFFVIFLLVFVREGVLRLNLAFRLLYGFIFLSLVGEVFARILAHQLKTGGPYYHFHVIFEYALISIIYSILIPFNKRFTQYWIYFSIGILTSFSLINSSFFQPVTGLPTNAILISSIFLIFLCLLMYTRLLLDISSNKLYKRSVFWFNTGVFLFYLITFFIFGYFNVFLRKKGVPMIAYNILYAANVVRLICFSLVFYLEIKSIKAKKQIA